MSSIEWHRDGIARIGRHAIDAGSLKKKKVVIVCEVCGDLPKGYEPLPDCPNPDVHN